MFLGQRLAAVAVVVIAAPLAVGTAAADTETIGGRGLAATLRYTEYGIPHIKANSYPGLGYGYGYAAAKDNICELADTYVTVNAQRSRYFGPDAPANPAYGPASSSLASDLYFQQVIDSGQVERSVNQQVPHGPRAEVREIVRGYAAGYNRYLKDTGVAGITDPACRSAAWARPITETDVYRHFHAIATLGGQALVIDGITSAAPPSGQQAATEEIPSDAAQRVQDTLGNKDMGSNAIAIGRHGTANGHGLLLGNPHFPWHGGRRFWQAQLTVPGQLDVTGSSLLGMPLVQIGHNRDVAWSHTVATPTTFGLYQVTLSPGSPTTYLVDGKPEEMSSRRIGVDVRNADGTVSRVERTLWSTRYGPVTVGGLGLPLSWTSSTAFAIRDANQGNLRGLNTWFEIGKAGDTRDIVHALSSTLGSPWVNTIAADRAGNALYADIQVVPHVTDELAKRCNTPLGASIFPSTGLTVLDGARTDCAWGSDPDAVSPGIFGAPRQPLLTRDDYVANSNDSAWLTNPGQPITGYPRIIGDIGTARGPRTRMAITAVEEQLAAGKLTRQSMQELLFSDRSMTAELVASDAAKMCAAFPDGRAPTSTGTVDVSDACPALSTWDNRYTTASRGALLFDRFWSRVARPGVNPWLTGFDPADPVRTPNRLDIGNPLVQKAFGDAVAELRAANIPPGAPLGQHQFVVRGGEQIAVHGGINRLGVLNMIVPSWDPTRGNTEVVHGSSFIQAVSFGRGSCPDTATLLTYSQSANPNSPHHVDQTRLFSQGNWVRGRFCERDILTSPGLRVVHLREH